MVDDVLINKAATIERCVIRAQEESKNHQPRLRWTTHARMPPS